MSNRKYKPVDDYAGDPIKEFSDNIKSGVSFFTKQYKSLAFETTIVIDENLADIKDLELNGWSPKKIDNKIVVCHKTRNFPMPWVDMIVREFVA
jgi:hypothetical protein